MSKTEVVFVIDRSGSMCGKEDDTIGGFNSMLEEQKKLDGKCFITTILFDDKIEILHDHVNVNDMQSITKKEYFVRGSTSLLDGLGRGITLVETRADKEDNVILVVITDGYENSSREFSLAKIKELVEKKQKEDAWEFIFLGAGIDAIEAGGSMGFVPQSCASYDNTGENTRKSYKAMSETMSSARLFGTRSAEYQATSTAILNDLGNKEDKKKKEDKHRKSKGFFTRFRSK